MVLYIRFDKCVVLLLWSRVRPGGVKFCRATMTTKVSWRRYGWSYTERSRCRITSRKPADVDTTTTSTTPFRTQEQWVPPASLSHYFDQSRTLATCASIRHDTIRDQKLAGYCKLRTKRNKVSYRKQIARQYLSQKFWDTAGARPFGWGTWQTPYKYATSLQVILSNVVRRSRSNGMSVIMKVYREMVWYTRV